jgi:hypothetical protein
LVAGGIDMMRVRVLVLTTALLFFALPAAAKMTRCHMTYDLKGWSLFYKGYRGHGVVKCGNGQSARVALQLHAGGATFGKSEIRGGKATFSEVTGIEEVYGTYGSAEGHAGVVRSAEGRGLTRGEVSLSMTGTGRGWDLGTAFGALTIRRQ